MPGGAVSVGAVVVDRHVLRGPLVVARDRPLLDWHAHWIDELAGADDGQEER